MTAAASDPPDWGLSGTQLTVVLVGVLAIVGLLVARIIVLSRRQDHRGYRFGAHVVVRCREGHLFTTTWVPFVSFKAIRLGLVRVQFCPVGQHLTFVTIVRDEDLTDAQRRIAEHFHDGGVP